MIIQAVFLSLFLFVTPSSNPSSTGSIHIQFSGIENAKGFIELSVFNAKRGFPTTQQSVVETYRFEINNVNPSYTIKHLPYDEYAISCFWDKNDNQKLDTNFLGIPKEKVGTSNNPDSNGMPEYEDAKFQLQKSELHLSIQMN